jgi:serine/threonine-protein kinase
MVSEAIDVLEPGAVLAGRYRVVRSIKSGGMGVVYEVADLKTKRRLAMKTLRPGAVPSASRRARFDQEASITASIDNEHIVKVEDAGVDAQTKTAFLTMELLVGRDLGAVLEETGPLAPKRVVELLWQVGLALSAVHDAGIVHRDIKPENLFLTTRVNGEELVKILDFGVAKLVEADPKATAFVGTPLYMPPEQIRGEHPDPRADTYALGHVAFALLTAHAYLEPGNVLESAMRRALRYGIALPPTFDAWFDRATANEVARRFAAADELVAELGAALGIDTPMPRTRTARVAATATASAPHGIPTSPGSVDRSRAESLGRGDSMDGVASSRPSLVGRWKRLGGTALAGALGAIVAVIATRWNARPEPSIARVASGSAQVRSPEMSAEKKPTVPAKEELGTAVPSPTDGGSRSLTEARSSTRSDTSPARPTPRHRAPDDDLLSHH